MNDTVFSAYAVGNEADPVIVDRQNSADERTIIQLAVSPNRGSYE